MLSSSALFMSGLPSRTCSCVYCMTQRSMVVSAVDSNFIQRQSELTTTSLLTSFDLTSNWAFAKASMYSCTSADLACRSCSSEKGNIYRLYSCHLYSETVAGGVSFTRASFRSSWPKMEMRWRRQEPKSWRHAPAIQSSRSAPCQSSSSASSSQNVCGNPRPFIMIV
jgi:hypothetical protein